MPRAVVKSQVECSIREGGVADSKLVAADARPADLVRGLRESSRGYYRLRESDAGCPAEMNGCRWFIGAFCSSGKVGNELIALKQFVFVLDGVLGPRGDLLLPHSVAFPLQECTVG